MRNFVERLTFPVTEEKVAEIIEELTRNEVSEVE